jgi:hypothetical protein
MPARDEVIKNLLQRIPYPRLMFEPWKQNSFPSAVIPVRRIPDPTKPFCDRPLLFSIPFGKTARDQALELGGPVRKSVQQILNEGLAHMLPEPVGAGLQAAVEENASPHIS